jgi:hypothetical protein
MWARPSKRYLFKPSPPWFALFGLLIAASASAQSFRGYECTIDCSGHEAGHRWAEKKGIDNPDHCGGNSQSFIEGCRAYAEEQRTGGRDADDDDRDDDDDDDRSDDEDE